MKKIYMLLLLSGAVSDFCHAGSSDRTAVDLEAGIISTNQLQVQVDDGETGIQTTSQVGQDSNKLRRVEYEKNIQYFFVPIPIPVPTPPPAPAVSFCNYIGSNVIAGVTTLFIGFVFGKYW